MRHDLRVAGMLPNTCNTSHFIFMLSLGRLVRSAGRARDRPIMSTPPMTLIIMKGFGVRSL